MPFQISLAEWSLHRTIRSKKIDHLDFFDITKNKFGLSAVEYVNTFFFDKAKDVGYLNEMKTRADDLGIKSLLIMCDSEGDLGDPDPKQRTKAIENHYKWIDAAKFLGCHSIRVNARSTGSYDEQIKLATDGLQRLTQFAKDLGINIIVEKNYFPITKNNVSKLKVEFSTSFGRELEYYTGMVFKIYIKNKSRKINVISGGRYLSLIHI